MVRELKLYLTTIDHCPGSRVSGVAVIAVDRPKKYKKVIISLEGKAEVCWISFGCRKHKNIVAIDCGNNNITVWSREESPAGDLSAGEHRFPFEFRIPPDVPRSYEGQLGQVIYHIQVKVCQSGQFKRSHHTRALFTVKERPDILLPFRQPQSLYIQRRLRYMLCDVGSLTVTCTLPYTGFMIGDDILLTIAIESNATKSMCLYANLIRYDIYTESNDRKKVR